MYVIVYTYTFVYTQTIGKPPYILLDQESLEKDRLLVRQKSKERRMKNEENKVYTIALMHLIYN